MYSIHFFVDRHRVRIRAADTDQHDWPYEEAKRVRTCTSEDADGNKIKRIVVSAGEWSPSQLTYRPFLDAVQHAAQQAALLEDRGHCVFRKRHECTASEWADLMHWPWPGRKPGPRLLKAVRLVMVEGFQRPAAARAANLSEKHGTRTVQRSVAAMRRRLAEMRAMSAHAA